MPDRIDRTDDVPTLSTEERDRRWADVRGRMIQRNLDALVLWSNDRFWGMARANLKYLTHVAGTQGNAIGIFPLHGDPVVFADFHMLHNPYSVYDVYQDWVEDVRTFEGLGTIVDEIKEMGLSEGNIGLVSYKTMLSEANLPHTHLNTLKRKIPDASFEDATDLLNQARQIKSDEEIEMLRRAGEIARSMLDAFMAAEPGITEAEVYADMARAQIANGGEAYIFNFFDSGDPLSPSRQHLLHGKPQPLAPTQRTLQSGDLLKTEFHANYGGYLVAVEKGIVLEEAPP
ncbi:MAG: aminopeptidase P family N-terminal domain-containing protein, partial [Halobacteriales archaeon]|nr:aminopeptidase P family N-terminal domain-containing protein [Halobacteriales archaeon]